MSVFRADKKELGVNEEKIIYLTDKYIDDYTNKTIKE